jgi:hypothetical protein
MRKVIVFSLLLLMSASGLFADGEGRVVYHSNNVKETIDKFFDTASSFCVAYDSVETQWGYVSMDMYELLENDKVGTITMIDFEADRASVIYFTKNVYYRVNYRYFEISSQRELILEQVVGLKKDFERFLSRTKGL